MDQPEAVIEEVAQQATATPPLRQDLVCRSSFDMLELLGLYEVGRALWAKKDLQQWRDIFALGVSLGGLFTAEYSGEFTTLAVFWRTSNPIVDIAKRNPVPDPHGLFVYISQIWNKGGVRPVAALRSHLRRCCPGAREIALHDQRPRKRGKLKTFPLGTTAGMLAERNGHG